MNTDLALNEIKAPATAGAIAMTISPDSAALVPSNLGEVVAFATLMSRASYAVPKHCREQPGVCLGVSMQAFHWGMEPFAVANKSYFANDRLAYEAQLLAAVVLKNVPRKGMPRYTYTGDGAERQCTVEITMPDGEVVPLQSPKVGGINPKNSPLWKSDVDQQLGYYTIRAWARRHRPDVLLGVYDREEVVALGDEEKATSFEALEQRAETVVEVTEVEDPKPQKKAADKPQPAPAAAATAARSQAIERATTASGAGTETAAGSGGSSGATGQEELEEATTGFPSEDETYRLVGEGAGGGRITLFQNGCMIAAAPPARAFQHRLFAAHAPQDGDGPLGEEIEHSLTAAPDLLATQSGGTGADDGFPGDREPTDGHRPVTEPGDQPANERQSAPSGGFVDYAAAVADARDWPAIDLAKADLRKTEEWKAATYDMQEAAHRIAYVRLKELVDAGYRFDFLMDLQAYRSYCAWDADLESLKGNRAAVANTPAWKAASTPVKIALDTVYDKRVAAIKAMGEFE